jgi:16S rRNA (cytidine1402-2'-O)-methyltransferase
MPGRLILCSTPIGNLGDAPPRLAEAIASADAVYAEDTRRSDTLVRALGLDVRLRSYFVGNEADRADELGRRLAAGETVALLTDAGTPSVADPGTSAVSAARRAGAQVSIVPGPSAVTAAVAVSGFSGDRFAFEGFLPRKGKERTERIRGIGREARPSVLFVSPHRLAEDLSDLLSVLGADRAVCVTRELTKLHEEVWWGTLADAADRWGPGAGRGEFTIVVEGSSEPGPDVHAALELARTLVEDGLSPSAAARRAAALTGASRRDLYEGLTAG